ncbi:MAG: chemotaxis protein CheD [Carboxydocellales bacterium]|jgi:chemotaxis protein CheD
MSVFKVGMCEMLVVTPPDTLSTSGLGSCIGICLYDPLKKVAGMAHIMLPDSTQARGNINEARFADSAIPALINIMLTKGAAKERMVAKIAGGAQMFNFNNLNDIMRVGERNGFAVLAKLKQEGIPVLEQDIGGNFGRSIKFDPEDGKVYILTLDKGVSII